MGHLGHRRPVHRILAAGSGPAPGASAEGLGNVPRSKFSRDNACDNKVRKRESTHLAEPQHA